MKRRHAPVTRSVASLVSVLAGLTLAPLGTDSARTQAQLRRSPLVPDEMTVASIHTAFSIGALTCTQLVQSYLNRIDAYDDRGPALNALLTLNPKALETAAQMDARYAAGKATAGALHCIPVVLKDNYDTVDMRTTGGSAMLAKSFPVRDAFVVKRLRDAGALILAKANLTELARGACICRLGSSRLAPPSVLRSSR